MGYLQDFCAIPIGFLWVFHGISMYLFYDSSRVFILDVYGVPLGFLGDSLACGMIFLHTFG